MSYDIGKISIAMPYRNRRDQLYNTLKSIEYSDYKNIEVVIVNDGCEDYIDDFKIYFDYPINIINIDNNKKKWVNPCVPFNMALKNTTGEVVVLQNPECFHCGDILSFVSKNITDINYLVFSCLSISKKDFKDKNINKIIEEEKDVKKLYKKICNLLDPFPEFIYRDFNKTTMWYNHPTYRNVMFHFTSAIHKKNINKLNGFDERYRDGFGYDDNEFLERIKRLGLNVFCVSPENHFSIHQPHEIFYEKDEKFCHEMYERNKNIFLNITMKSDFYFAPNTIG